MAIKRFGLVAAFAGLLLVAGCGPAPSRDDLIGAWSRKDGGMVMFLPGGRFVARGVPAENLFGAAAGPPGKIDVEGTWRLMAPPGTREFGLDSWAIELQVEPTPIYAPGGAELRPTYGDGLISLDGDEDKTTFYERVRTKYAR